MGGCCGSRKFPSEDNVNTNPRNSPKPGLNRTQRSVESNRSTNTLTSLDILDDSFKTEITDIVEEDISTVPAKYLHERDRLVDEMQRAAPNRYLGLDYSEYPDINGATISQMARKAATSNEVKLRLINRVNQQIESSFRSRTADWSSSARQAARPIVGAFIEKCVKEGFNDVQLE